MKNGAPGIEMIRVDLPSQSQEEKDMVEIWNSLEKAAMKFALHKDILHEEIPNYLREDNISREQSEIDFTLTGNRYNSSGQQITEQVRQKPTYHQTDFNWSQQDTGKGGQQAIMSAHNFTKPYMPIG